MTQCAIKGHHLMPFLHAFTPEPGSSVILFVIIIAETGSEEGVYTPNHSSLRATANQLLLCNSSAGVTPPSTLKQFE
ncbi:TPA: hypothetical protein MH390_25165 [Klebsiella pneumoniae]|nr:hypothetical protein CQA15_22835 [Klebsiella pneumoniae]PCP32097.1 hypothetical protein CQA17_22620 [Klebsiella pneumoniae]PCP47916.1 hypothetical protein CQA39_22800 [Klebsiella pneumoniae]PCR79332.1 hypothetical protein CQA78_13870 [Klebsiella pneumoniae]HBX5141647.1 hypothetical protein [Klebsiella pneumoniae]